jgi:hypothetical protein
MLAGLEPKQLGKAQLAPGARAGDILAEVKDLRGSAPSGSDQS